MQNVFPGPEQQRVQERVALRLPEQHRGWTEHADRPLLRPVPVVGAEEAQQEAAAQLPVPPVLQQGPLHQGLSSGETGLTGQKMSAAAWCDHIKKSQRR